MHKVMLVDDEAFEREGLRRMLEKYRSNYTIVAEAKNGEEAIHYATLYKPDIIFMDIKMPGIDGLSALKTIYETQPETKFIMVSAFDTFEYARESMKFGVKEYLLKPSKAADIIVSFDRVVEEVEADAVNKSNEERSNKLMEIEFLTTLLMDHIHEYDLNDWRKWLHLEQSIGFFTLFTFASEDVYVSRREKEEWYQRLKMTLSSHELRCLVGPLTGFQVPVLVILNEETKNIVAMQEDFVRAVIRQTNPGLRKCRLVVGVSSVVERLEDFSIAYEQANQALEHVYENGHASFKVYHEELGVKRMNDYPIQLENELIERIQQGDIQASLVLFNQYFKQISSGAVKIILEHFFIVLSRKVKELGIAEDYIYSFQHLDSIVQIKEDAKTRITFIATRIQEWQKNNAEAVIIRVKKYIDKYYKDSITLEGVAEQFELSSYYLSKRFKEQFQISFIEYITELRIAESKALIIDVSVPLKEIALTVGYKDPNYFSRVFKKATGYSPSAYRNKYQKELADPM